MEQIGGCAGECQAARACGMRIIFMGTPEFSVPVLQALVDAGHDVVAAYSQPARRSGRGKTVTSSPVQMRAETLGIAVRTPVSLRDPDAQTEFAALRADVAVVAAYGLILPRAVLEAPRLGCLNVHASLLPRWRGAAPIQRAILAGDDATGVGIMQMEIGLDTGPVRLEGRTPIAAKTAGDLTDELSAMGARLMVDVLADIAAYPAIAQPAEGITYAPKIDKAETRLDFSKRAVEVERQVRGFNPPGAWFEVQGERVRVLAASADPDKKLAFGQRHGSVVDEGLAIQCGDVVIRPILLQRAGRGVMTAEEFLRGFSIPVGTQL